MEEWGACLSERLQPDVRARIIGSKARMQRFDFFFGLHLRWPSSVEWSHAETRKYLYSNTSLWTGSLFGERVRKSRGEGREIPLPSPSDCFRYPFPKQRACSRAIATQEYISRIEHLNRNFCTLGTSKSSNFRKVYFTYWLYWIV